MKKLIFLILIFALPAVGQNYNQTTWGYANTVTSNTIAPSTDLTVSVAGEDRLFIDADGMNIFNGGDITLRDSDSAGNLWDTTSTYWYGTDRAANNEAELVHNRFVGSFAITQDVQTGVDNSTSIQLLPQTTICAPIGGGTEAADSNDYRHNPDQPPAYSYELTFDSSVAAGEGLDCNISGPTTTGYTRTGFWIKSSVTFASGDLEIVLDDGGVAEATVAVGEDYIIANRWQYIVVNVTAACAAACSDLDGWFLQTTSQAPTTFNDAVINLDQAVVYKTAAEIWLQAQESNYVYPEGVMSVVAYPNAGGAPVKLVENTDYLNGGYAGAGVYPVMLTDQSANTLIWTFSYYPWQYDQ